MILTVNRRTLMKTGGLAAVGALTGGVLGCGPSREKAVRVIGFAIELSREAQPLLTLLGAQEIASLLDTKAIPALEKLKEALSKIDIPAGRSALATVRSVLSGIGTAVSNLPPSDRRTTIVGILASINVLLLTVEAFVNSEMEPATKAVVMSPSDRAEMTEKINKALEVSKP